MMRTILFGSLVGLMALPTVASAGSPCPIDLTFYDLKSPDGVDHSATLDALKSRESWVGISFGNAKAGVIIKAVSENSPAQRGGLEVGDIVTVCNGERVKTHPELNRLLGATAPGGLVKLTIKRGDDAKTLEFNLGRHDPVFGQLVLHASKDSCHEVRRGDIKEDLRASLVRAVQKNGNLLCNTAHSKLEDSKAGLAEGTVLFVRGAKKILVTMPGEDTVCMKAKSIDGKKLTPRGIKRLFKKVIGGYIADRHKNP